MDVVIMALIEGIGKIKKAVKIAIKDPVYAMRLIKGVRRHGVRWALDKSKGRLFAESLSNGYSYDEEEDLDTVGMLGGLARKPLISIVMPVYNVEIRWLDEAVKSVLSSTYDNFELVIVDDCSTELRVAEYLSLISDSRVKMIRNDKNLGISETSNRGAEASSGEYIVMMDNDDILHRNAILHIAAEALASEPDMIYTDEDKTDQNGVRKSPFYKPDWSPDLLRSQMYIGHIFAFRKGFFQETGGFRKEFDGAQDYDLALRMSERTSRISHIPRVLYSWRELKSSTAMNPDSKPYAHTAGLKALDGHLKRVFGPGAHAEETDQWYVYDSRYPVLKDDLLASIIINGTSGIEEAKRLIEDISTAADGLKLEIFIRSDDSKVCDLDSERSSDVSVRAVMASEGGSWGEWVNSCIREATGDVIILMDAKIKQISTGWIQRLAEAASKPGTGIAGAMITTPDKVIISAGLTVLKDGTIQRLFSGSPAVHISAPFVSPSITRNVLGVDGNLMAISRNCTILTGQFDESASMMESVIDYGLRCLRRGLNNVYIPYVRAELDENGHTESICCESDNAEGTRVFGTIDRDPYLNPGLRIESGLPKVKLRH